MLANQYERKFALQVSDIESQLDDAEGLRRAERAIRETLESELHELRLQVALYGDDPAGLARRNDELTMVVRDLRDQLSLRPNEEETADLRRRADRTGDAEAQAELWRQRHDHVDRQLRYQLSSVGELEVLRDERDALAAQRETLRQALDKHKQDWEELQSREGQNEPFPACTAYDSDPQLQQWFETREPEDLADLVHEVRNRMATEPTPFYYSESDVRLFLAGLASNRLHLLQGISGTGKTSLPREFFRAVGGEVEIIEVQAGWRDKDDLFGYYNAFEKRFAEGEFTKALYRALQPANEDRLIVIVLDEMNLAHPEQYFGTMLSALENTVQDKVDLALLTSSLPNLPRLFDGSRLPLAPNVWFVGTANHDETTVAFADKTYDRSHVQELPDQHLPFAARHQGLADPVSFRDLQARFREATATHRASVDKARTFLTEVLRPQFGSMGIGWGNRLERQLGTFVPVVVAAGGTLTEALDHIVATKLVRKLQDRFGVDADQLEILVSSIEQDWKQFDGGTPAKTTKKLRDEAVRLRGGFAI
jgi:hypothetical protein